MIHLIAARIHPWIIVAPAPARRTGSYGGWRRRHALAVSGEVGLVQLFRCKEANPRRLALFMHIRRLRSGSASPRWRGPLAVRTPLPPELADRYPANGLHPPASTSASALRRDMGTAPLPGPIPTRNPGSLAVRPA